MEDSVKEAFHHNEQTSRTLEYAFDDFAVAQMAKLLHDSRNIRRIKAIFCSLDKNMLGADYKQLMRPFRKLASMSSIQRPDGQMVSHTKTGKWENNGDLVHRKSYITEGATCHYTWYVPQNRGGSV